MTRNIVAVLLVGSLMLLLAPTAAWAQNTTGSLFFANRVSGSRAAGYFDRYGYFHQTVSPTGTLFKGLTHTVNTSNGVLTYNATTGVGMVMLFEDNGSMSSNTYVFSVGWTHIVSVGDYLFFYKDDGSGAVGQINADGSFTSGLTYAAGSFPYYSHIVATANNIFFYNSSDGSAATAYIHKGAFVYTQKAPAGTLPTGYSYLVSNGNFVLLYNQVTGSTLIGVIDGRPGMFTSRATITLPGGYSKLVKHDRFVLFYNTQTGAGTIGYVDRASAAKFIITQSPAFAPNWTSIVSTNDDLLFYNSGNGSGAAGQIDATGKFHQTPQKLSFSAGWSSVVATTR